MVQPKKLTYGERNLVRRYLIWFYKTTKDELDRIDRKFTQVLVDDFIFDHMQLSKSPTNADTEYLKMLNDFRNYIQEKKVQGQDQKFIAGQNKVLNARYRFLMKRLSAVQAAIGHFLGARELRKIIDLYEQEMTGRILQSREH